VDEFVSVMKLHEYYYKKLGINKYHLELALRDPNNTKKYHGDAKMWKLAEDLMRKAVAKTNIPMVEQVGSAAFYGPKIDFIVHSSIGREFAVSTNQIDLFMGKRFGLKYTDVDGSEKTPVIIHRAPLGSHERFIGFLIEHYAGAFPLWLSPTQVSLIPIAERHNDYAKKVLTDLTKVGLRAEIDSRSESMQKKIRIAQSQKVNYMIIIGDKEVETNNLSIRTRAGVTGNISTSNLIEKLTNLNSQRSNEEIVF
jgi:threonyl-tRNA synthetase